MYSGTVLRLKHFWRCHCLLEKGYARRDTWPYQSQRRQVFCFSSAWQHILRGEIWGIGLCSTTAHKYAPKCSSQAIVFRDGKHLAHLISVVTDVSRDYLSSNSKHEELNIIIALRTSAFPLVYKPLQVACPVQLGVAVESKTLSGQALQLRAPQIRAVSGSLWAPIAAVHHWFDGSGGTGMLYSPWGNGQREFKNATAKMYRISVVRPQVPSASPTTVRHLCACHPAHVTTSQGEPSEGNHRLNEDKLSFQDSHGNIAYPLCYTNSVITSVSGLIFYTDNVHATGWLK